MSEVLLKLPLDAAGTALTNKVEKESHALNGRRVRAIKPDYGTYFVKTMTVVDTDTGNELTSAQWRAGEIQPDDIALYGKPLALVVMITDENINGPIELNYQALGGGFSISKKAFLDKIADLDLSGETFDFNEIIGLPEGFTPEQHHQHSSTVFEAGKLNDALLTLKHAVDVGNKGAMDELYSYINTIIQKAKEVSGNGAAGEMQAHTAAPNPHTQLVLKTDIEKLLAPVRKTVNTIPAAGALNVGLETALEGFKYQSLYGVTQKAAQFQVSTKADLSELLYDATLGAVIKFQPPNVLPGNTAYYWRVRYQDTDDVWGIWSDITTFNTAAIAIAKPALTSPLPNVGTDTQTPTLRTGAFVVTGSTDTHMSSDWEVWTGPGGTGTRVWSSVNDLVNKLSAVVGSGILVQNNKYYARARHRGTKYGYSAWTDDVGFFATWAVVPTVVGQAYAGGFWGGDITFGGKTYAVVVAPKQYEVVAALTGNTEQRSNASVDDSVANTAALLVGAANDSAVVQVRAMSVGAYNDWQVPSLNVMKLLFNKLRASSPGAPVAFLTGGQEAFNETNYWTSTAHNWTESVTGPPTPNYGYKTVTDGPKNLSQTYYPASNATTPPATCAQGDVVNQSFSYNPTTVNGQSATINTTTWSCQYQEYGIISYTPGTTTTVTRYEGRVQSMAADGSTEVIAYSSKLTALRVRPVRLVLKA